MCQSLARRQHQTGCSPVLACLEGWNFYEFINYQYVEKQYGSFNFINIHMQSWTSGHWIFQQVIWTMFASYHFYIHCIDINALHAKFFERNINMYLQFISFIENEWTKTAEILPHVKQELNQCSKLNQKSCQSCCLESQIINIKLKKSFKKLPGPPPKLSASGWRTGSNLEHWLNLNLEWCKEYRFDHILPREKFQKYKQHARTLLSKDQYSLTCPTIFFGLTNTSNYVFKIKKVWGSIWLCVIAWLQANKKYEISPCFLKPGIRTKIPYGWTLAIWKYYTKQNYNAFTDRYQWHIRRHMSHIYS